ncbi:PhzF family phenazine biosynthesis protein [Pseudomonas benzenivorans]|uniref:PhzF family phenazine biosynthesis protein n=1 Tax=Pseudomonas benzenivorans TaxID=556533 RepID=A0ABY5HA06_9PSED|nr:PhzF family phenazine biosynthesis isomerase [Pseudomonas benzenivorans]UTW08224.1 PhzF family phenazine biosynthesis protein [Pseudomonas benzenivorans]
MSTSVKDKGAIDLPFAIYDAFTSTPYSGSQGASILNASDIPPQMRPLIAKEIGAPATAFVDMCTENQIKVQFFSTVAELPMCGHGTVCLITRLVDAGLLACPETGIAEAILNLPKGSATVEFGRNAESRVEVMLDVSPATFTGSNLDMERLAFLLGVTVEDFSTDFPAEVASADFIHLCLPMRGLAAMARLKPNMDALAQFCRENGLETIATFSTEVQQPGRTVHVRDFCPAVGVAESAAAGTTNAALATYLLRKGIVLPGANGDVLVQAEQGMELGRPSHVTTRITLRDSEIERLQVGGVASRVIDGKLQVLLGGES